MTNMPKRPADVIGSAVHVAQIAFGKAEGVVKLRLQGASLSLGNNQSRGPHVPEKGLGNDPANDSKRGYDEPDTAIERNTIFPGHSKPSDCHRRRVT